MVRAPAARSLNAVTDRSNALLDVSNSGLAVDTQIIEALRFRIVLDLKETGSTVENDNEVVCEILRVIDAA
jgi:hypothetical protein